MEHGPNLYAAKIVSWPGATPFCPAVCGQIPFGASRVTPGRENTRFARSFGVVCRVQDSTFVLATLQRLFVEHLDKGSSMRM